MCGLFSIIKKKTNIGVQELGATWENWKILQKEMLFNKSKHCQVTSTLQVISQKDSMRQKEKY